MREYNSSLTCVGKEQAENLYNVLSDKNLLENQEQNSDYKYFYISTSWISIEINSNDEIILIHLLFMREKKVNGEIQKQDKEK